MSREGAAITRIEVRNEMPQTYTPANPTYQSHNPQEKKSYDLFLTPCLIYSTQLANHLSPTLLCLETVVCHCPNRAWQVRIQ